MSPLFERGGKRPEASVIWVPGTSPEELGGINFPATRLWKERALVTEVGAGEIAVGVFALPPQEPLKSRFWHRLISRVGGEIPEKLPPTRLKMQPRISTTEVRDGLYTPLSALHNYVVLEDESLYGIGVWIPRGMFGEWSDPEERRSVQVGYSSEVFQQREGVALLVRVNGDTPLGLHKTTGLQGPQRHETLLGLSAPEEGERDVPFLIDKQTVHETDGTAHEWDIKFEIVAERGTDANAALSANGHTQILVMQTLHERVIERTAMPFQFDNFRSPYDNLTMGGDVLMRTTRSASPDSSLQGRTNFVNKRKVERPVSQVLSATPVAKFELALVGNGGPVTAHMTEAVLTSQSAE